MSDKIERVLELKAEVEKAKIDKAKLEGSLKQMMQRLKDDFEVKTVEEAKKLLKSLKKEAVELEEQIEEAITKLEEKYDW